MEEEANELDQKDATSANEASDEEEVSTEKIRQDESFEMGGDDEAKDLDFILDIPLEISVELGRTKMIVNDLLQLARGSIIELSKLAEEPMDIYINRKLFARGEVVVVNEKFGIRLTDIVSPAERVKSLGGLFVSSRVLCTRLQTQGSKRRGALYVSAPGRKFKPAAMQVVHDATPL